MTAFRTDTIDGLSIFYRNALFDRYICLTLNRLATPFEQSV